MLDEKGTSLDGVAGLTAVKERFGYWPSFHDAEIVSLRLERDSSSWLRIRILDTVNGANMHGRSNVLEHTVVSFILDDIQDLNLVQFSVQNVISGLVLSKTADGYSIELGCCYGLCGSIKAKSIRVELESDMHDAT